jgi:HEXXH motif-containing protein
MATQPLAPPRDLTIPEAGSRTAREVLGRALRRVLGELRALPRALWVPPAERAEVALWAEVLEEVLAQDPGLVASVLRRPTVGTLVRCLRKDSGPDADRVRGAQRFAELRALVALEFGLAGRLPRPVPVSAAPRLLSQRADLDLTPPPGTTELLFDNDRIVASCGDQRSPWVFAQEHNPGWVSGCAFHPLGPSLALTLVDNNPLAMTEAHPDKHGNAVDLGGRPPEAWCKTLQEALDLLARYLPALREELELFVHQVVPVGYDAHRHLSASYLEALGTVYLTLHPSLMTMTEALLHEFSHNKLNALLELDPVLENAFWPLYPSPVRPDPRPLHGIVLAVHAFQPVARLYETMLAQDAPESRRGGFRERYAQVRGANRRGVEVLRANARPTPLGRGLLEEFQRWDAHYTQVPDETPGPPQDVETL